jgi:hypothetical protein
MVTGALGSIGLSTMAALLAEGHDVVAFDLESRRARKLASGFGGRVRFVWGDITFPQSLRDALEDTDAVIHLAAIIPPYSEKAPDLARRVNLEGTACLIAEMEASPTAKRLPVDAFVRTRPARFAERLGGHRGKPTPASVPEPRPRRTTQRHEGRLRRACADHPSDAPSRHRVCDSPLCLPEGEPEPRCRLADTSDTSCTG